MPLILATQEAEIGRMKVPDQSSQKVCKIPISMENSWVWWCTCHPSNGGKLKLGGLQSRPAWAKSKMLSQK
jgi:hypothetical protein